MFVDTTLFNESFNIEDYAYPKQRSDIFKFNRLAQIYNYK